MPADGHYSFANVDGGYDGLVRVSENGVRFDCVHNGAWVNRQELWGRFINPGSDVLERIDDATAHRLAETVPRDALSGPPKKPKTAAEADPAHALDQSGNRRGDLAGTQGVRS